MSGVSSAPRRRVGSEPDPCESSVAPACQVKLSRSALTRFLVPRPVLLEEGVTASGRQALPGVFEDERLVVGRHEEARVVGAQAARRGHLELADLLGAEHGVTAIQ